MGIEPETKCLPGSHLKTPLHSTASFLSELVIIEILNEELLLGSSTREIFLLDWPLINLVIRTETTVGGELVLVVVLAMATSGFARG